MAYNYEWPYVDADQYNNDWLINKVKELASEWVQVEQEWKTEQEAFENLKAYIENYFNTLDVQEEINNKINEMVANGELLSIMKDTIINTANTWLATNITNPTSPPLDATFTLVNSAAQSRQVGNVGYLFRSSITGSSLASNISPGTYMVDLSNVTDGPPGLTSNAILINVRGLGSTTIQYILTTKDVTLPWARVLTDTGNVYIEWYNTKQYAIRGDISGNLLANNTNPGTYMVNLTNVTDGPSGLTGLGMLINLIGLGTTFVQYIITTKDVSHPWVRVLNADKTVYIQWMKSNQNPRYQKSWIVVGDSFTHGDWSGITPPPNIGYGRYYNYPPTYPYLIGNDFDYLITNLSQNGLRIGGDNGFAKNSFNVLPTDFDYITIALGINDTPSHQNTPIGTIDDATIDTFYGSWNVLMNTVYTKSPSAHIGIIATMGIANNEIEYTNAIIEIAKKWCVPYLNFSTGEQVPTLLRSGKSLSNHSPIAISSRNSAFQVSDTNGHPNVKAHEYMAMVIGEWMKTI